VEVSTRNDDAGTDDEASLGKLDLSRFPLSFPAGVDREQIIPFGLVIDNPPAIDRYIGEQKPPGRTASFRRVDDPALQKINKA